MGRGVSMATILYPMCTTAGVLFPTVVYKGAIAFYLSLCGEHSKYDLVVLEEVSRTEAVSV